jgi:tripartite-type tricarboxylate transporter receptor subunit TctC
MKRRTLTTAALAAAIGLSIAPLAHSQAWPAGPVRIIVPFGPGALTDLAARNIAAGLSGLSGRQFVVENKGGAGGTIGTAEVTKAKPDGNTLVFTDSSLTISPGLYSKLPYDVQKDLTPITMVVEAPAILVARTQLGAKTLKDVVAMARAKPKGLTFGSGGQGSSAHLAGEVFFGQASINLTHVPFKGVAAALTDVAGNQIDLSFSSLGGASGHIRGNRVVPLALSGAARSKAFPDVPTFRELGYPNYDVVYRFGLLGPAGMSPEMVKTLQDGVAQAVQAPKMKAFLDSQGAVAIRVDGAQFADAIRRDLTMWKQAIDRAGVKIQ